MKHKWITAKLLKKLEACEEGYVLFEEEHGNSLVDIITLTENEIKRGDEERLTYMNWLIVRCMHKEQYLQYAVFAAKKVLHLFENEHPDNKVPRKAIEAAEKCLKNPRGKDAAHYVAKAMAKAAYLVADSAYTQYAVNDVAYAAYAAYAAANAAANKDYSAYSAYAAHYAAKADYDVAKKKLKIEILKYGIELLKGSKS